MTTNPQNRDNFRSGSDQEIFRNLFIYHWYSRLCFCFFLLSGKNNSKYYLIYSKDSKMYKYTYGEKIYLFGKTDMGLKAQLWNSP